MRGHPGSRLTVGSFCNGVNEKKRLFAPPRVVLTAVPQIATGEMQDKLQSQHTESLVSGSYSTPVLDSGCKLWAELEERLLPHSSAESVLSR